MWSEKRGEQIVLEFRRQDRLLVPLSPVMTKRWNSPKDCLVTLTILS